MNSVISIDPGPAHTAVLLIDDIDYSALTFRIAAKTMLTFKDRSKLYRVFERYAAQLDAIVLEDFKLQPSKAQAQSYSRFETVKIIERITYQLECLDLTHLLVMQQPGQRKSANGITPEHRAALTTDVPLKERDHYYAAYQHARYYIAMTNITMLPVVCQACGWKSNTRMHECFNCSSKLKKIAT
jgi:hypothetical protein